LGSVLSQVKEDGRVHPIAFHSRKFEAAEINYEVHDKELVSIVNSFEQWHQLLEGSSHQNMNFKPFWTQNSCVASYIILWTGLTTRLMIEHGNLLKTLAMLLNF
jgi:hypothetical protein